MKSSCYDQESAQGLPHKALTVHRENVANKPKHNAACEEIAVKSVEQAAMARDEVGSVFHAGFSLHRTLQEVSEQARKEDDDALCTDTRPVDCWMPMGLV